jgi:hypothetical protein
MKNFNEIPKSFLRTHSTFLVGKEFFHRFIKPNFSKRKDIAIYLHKLLHDPRLDYKLSFLNSTKWKKVYQSGGQMLQRVHFVPDDSDWARLSIISHASGHSMCFIFVYLLLLDMGYLKLPVKQYGTPLKMHTEPFHYGFQCEIILYERAEILLRILQT